MVIGLKIKQAIAVFGDRSRAVFYCLHKTCVYGIIHKQRILLSDKMSALKEWCSKKRGNLAGLAEHINTSAGYLCEIKEDIKPLPTHMIRSISAYTGIPARELRPDLWEIFKDE